MKYISLSVALLLSAPAFAMEETKFPLCPENAEFSLVPLPKEDTSLQALNPISALSLTKTDDYESDTEKGLSKENIQLYRFNKSALQSVGMLSQAHAILGKWFTNPENEKMLEGIPALVTSLSYETIRIEAWLKELGSGATRTSGFKQLKGSVYMIKTGLLKSFNEKEEKCNDLLEGNLSHPASQFFLSFESLSDLVEKSR